MNKLMMKDDEMKMVEMVAKDSMLTVLLTIMAILLVPLVVLVAIMAMLLMPKIRRQDQDYEEPERMRGVMQNGKESGLTQPHVMQGSN